MSRSRGAAGSEGWDWTRGAERSFPTRTVLCRYEKRGAASGGSSDADAAIGAECFGCSLAARCFHTWSFQVGVRGGELGFSAPQRLRLQTERKRGFGGRQCEPYVYIHSVALWLSLQERCSHVCVSMQHSAPTLLFHLPALRLLCITAPFFVEVN